MLKWLVVEKELLHRSQEIKLQITLSAKLLVIKCTVVILKVCKQLVSSLAIKLCAIRNKAKTIGVRIFKIC